MKYAIAAVIGIMAAVVVSLVPKAQAVSVAAGLIVMSVLFAESTVLYKLQEMEGKPEGKGQ